MDVRSRTSSFGGLVEQPVVNPPSPIQCTSLSTIGPPGVRTIPFAGLITHLATALPIGPGSGRTRFCCSPVVMSRSVGAVKAAGLVRIAGSAHVVNSTSIRLRRASMRIHWRYGIPPRPGRRGPTRSGRPAHVPELQWACETKWRYRCIPVFRRGSTPRATGGDWPRVREDLQETLLLPEAERLEVESFGEPPGALF